MQAYTSNENATIKNETALVLGGGGTRGFAHIGVIRALEEAGIDFDFVIGTSVGAFVGAMYAAGVLAKDMKRYADELDIRDIHNRFWVSPNNPIKIANILESRVGRQNIEDLVKRFVCVATDIKEGRQHIMEHGDLGSAVAASCCVPLAFRPVVRGGFHLVDGGLLNNIPSDVAKMLGAKKVVAVDINPTRGGGTESLKTFEVLKATLSIISSHSSTKGLLQSDLIIEPDLSLYKPTNKDGYINMIRIGYEATMEKVEDIKQLLAKQ